MQETKWKYIRDKVEEWLYYCAFSCTLLSFMTIVLDMNWNPKTKFSFACSVIAFSTYNTFLRTGKECFMRKKDDK